MTRSQYNTMDIVYNFDGHFEDGRYFSRRYFERLADGSRVEITNVDDIESIEAFSDDGSDNEETAFRNHSERRFR